jgi:hypothetical protein
MLKTFTPPRVADPDALVFDRVLPPQPEEVEEKKSPRRSTATRLFQSASSKLRSTSKFSKLADKPDKVDPLFCTTSLPSIDNVDLSEEVSEEDLSRLKNSTDEKDTVRPCDLIMGDEIVKNCFFFGRSLQRVVFRKPQD